MVLVALYSTLAGACIIVDTAVAVADRFVPSHRFSADLRDGLTTNDLHCLAAGRRIPVFSCFLAVIVSRFVPAGYVSTPCLRCGLVFSSAQWIKVFERIFTA